MSDLRSRVIRLAHARPELRPALLPLLKSAMEHPSREALEEYLKKHPNADRGNHTVKKTEEKGEGKKDEGEKPKIRGVILTSDNDKQIGDLEDWLPPDERGEAFTKKYPDLKKIMEISRKVQTGDDDGGGEIPELGDRDFVGRVMSQAGSLQKQLEKDIQDGFDDDGTVRKKVKDLDDFLDGLDYAREDASEGGKKASLRSSVIRLAHRKPELRPVLLPLLKR